MATSYNDQTLSMYHAEIPSPQPAFDLQPLPSYGSNSINASPESLEYQSQGQYTSPAEMHTALPPQEEVFSSPTSSVWGFVSPVQPTYDTYPPSQPVQGSVMDSMGSNPQRLPRPDDYMWKELERFGQMASSQDFMVGAGFGMDFYPPGPPPASTYTYPRSYPTPPPRSPVQKSCSHCNTKTTPLWRRDPSTMKPLCNACGLYLQQRNKPRPHELIEADQESSRSPSPEPEEGGPQCEHCKTRKTSVWRRGKKGEQLCNACGVYLRLRGRPRPLTLKNVGRRIKPRAKHNPKPKQ